MLCISKVALLWSRDQLLWTCLSAGDPDTNVTINRQKAIDSLRYGFSFVSPALLDLMTVQVRSLESSRSKSSHMYGLVLLVQERVSWTFAASLMLTLSDLHTTAAGFRIRNAFHFNTNCCPLMAT